MQNSSAARLFCRLDRRHRAEMARPNEIGDSFGVKYSSNSAAILIDTLAIRIALKSFAVITGARSNRHSSEPLSLQPNPASAQNALL